MQVRILNVFSFEHPLSFQLIDMLNEKGKKVENVFLIDKLKFKFWHLIFKTLFSLKKEIVLFHAMGLFNIALLTLFSMFSINKKRVSVFWGSDFNLSGDKRNLRFLLVSRFSHRILFANEDMANRFVKKYGGSKKVRIVRFGLKSLEDIDFVLSEGFVKTSKRKSVHVCSNSSPNQQTLEVIHTLEQLQAQLFELGNEVEFVFNLAYGDQDYKVTLIETLERSNLCNIVIDSEFRRGTSLAKHRLSADILINVQRADMLSGAMQEVLYSGNKVIIGNWLNYNCLTNLGCKFYVINRIEDLGQALLASLKESPDNSEQIQLNRLAIGSLSLWSNSIKTWVGVIDELYP